MALHVGESGAPAMDNLGTARSRVIPAQLISDECALWHEILLDIGSKNRTVAKLATSVGIKMYDAASLSQDLARRESAWHSSGDDMPDAYFLVASGRLAADYALSRLARLVVPAVIIDNRCFINGSLDRLAADAPALIISRRSFTTLLADDDGMPKIGEWWFADDEDSMHVQYMQPATPSNALLRALSEELGCSQDHARRIINPLGSVALVAYVRGTFLDKHASHDQPGVRN